MEPAKINFEKKSLKEKFFEECDPFWKKVTKEKIVQNEEEFWSAIFKNPLNPQGFLELRKKLKMGTPIILICSKFWKMMKKKKFCLKTSKMNFFTIPGDFEL